MLTPDEWYILLDDGRYAVINRPPKFDRAIIIQLPTGENISVMAQNGLNEGNIVVVTREGINYALNYKNIVDATTPVSTTFCPLPGKIYTNWKVKR